MAKLTLSVDDEVIKAAKNWAKVQGLSVSQMVSVFFTAVTRSRQTPDDMPPVLRKLTGILGKEKRPIEKYHEHIERKYL